MLKRTSAGLLSHHFEELLGNTAFNILYNAPALIVISSLAESTWAVEDCTLAAQNLMLVATAAGLGTCWIGFAQGWLATPEGQAALELPGSYQPVAPIIVGYPKFVPTADREERAANSMALIARSNPLPALDVHQ